MNIFHQRVSSLVKDSKKRLFGRNLGQRVQTSRKELRNLSEQLLRAGENDYASLALYLSSKLSDDEENAYDLLRAIYLLKNRDNSFFLELEVDENHVLHRNSAEWISKFGKEYMFKIEEMYMEVIRMFEQAKEISLCASLCCEIGYCCLKVEHYNQALGFFTKAIEYAEDVKHSILILDAIDKSVECNCIIKDYTKAISLLRKKMKLIPKIPSKTSKFEIQFTIVLLQMLKNVDYSESFDLCRKYTSIHPYSQAMEQLLILMEHYQEALKLGDVLSILQLKSELFTYLTETQKKLLQN